MWYLVPNRIFSAGLRRFAVVLATMAESALSKAGIDKDPKELTNEEWRKILSPQQYHIMREAGTEKFSGEYVRFLKDGVFHCAACGAELFDAQAKFEAHCGWPSFSEALKKAAANDDNCSVIRRPDTSHGMLRTEVLCRKCSSHLGHVFDDGPMPSGERYCINSLSLSFSPKTKE